MSDGATEQQAGVVDGAGRMYDFDHCACGLVIRIVRWAGGSS